MQENDTIVAISTPVGRGGIGIVRLSGPRACEVAAPMLRLRHELAAGRARFGELIEAGAAEGGEPRVLDEIVATYFAAPQSYTGEDVVEIAMHGSPVLLEYVVRECCRPDAQCAARARLAEPGEFTQRAFLAGRIDLTQAEAVGDLIESSTLEQARVAARQMGGALARQVAPVKAELIALIATLEAGIDFAEDDIDVMAAAQILERMAAVREPLETLERSFAFGRVVRDGFRLAIVGRPNVGKSSLFNRLVERERAIVTATPGTTRDLVTERVSIDGIPVELVDTAGLREASDEAERIGIAKSREAMADADVVLLVVDATVGLSAEDRAVLENGAGREVIVARNKSDLLSDPAGAEPETAILTSALNGKGIAELRAAIVRSVAGERGGLRESGMLTNVRQHQTVQQAVRGLDAACAAVEANIPHEMVLLDLYEALRGLDALTGATTTEDVLRLIFSTFCIGK
ncbi:MAG TPA: tRNA uridine-5-carboxymethylaminomethyl(34) synthesis GTPase MnmE [Acidobacteriaceae bacterium]|jgi:tRNA modification GTPase|nr:tRNA uridine-5-carboxymethylaminomethyl(34) synthesis GTPase MnmE [Acidobacteriaceae bacterium]